MVAMGGKSIDHYDIYIYTGKPSMKKSNNPLHGSKMPILKDGYFQIETIEGEKYFINQHSIESIKVERVYQTA